MANVLLQIAGSKFLPSQEYLDFISPIVEAERDKLASEFGLTFKPAEYEPAPKSVMSKEFLLSLGETLNKIEIEKIKAVEKKKKKNKT